MCKYCEKWSLIDKQIGDKNSAVITRLNIGDDLDWEENKLKGHTYLNIETYFRPMKKRTYNIEAKIRINYCPWCGQKLEED